MIDNRAWTPDELAAYRAELERRASPDYVPKKRGKSGKRWSAFDRAQFVAWDGEGETDADGVTHRYTLLAAGWYDTDETWQMESIEAVPGERLTTRDCFEFMRRVTARVHRQAIHVGYALTYDWTHILYDLDRASAWDALAPSRQHWGWFGDWAVKILPRHELRILHKTDGERDFSFGMWDVFGFFQSSFVTAVEKWLGDDYIDLPRIRLGKSQRGAHIDDVDLYNEAELRALVELMRALRRSLAEADLVLSRWDGAGAAAVGAIRKHMSDYKPFFDRAHWLQEREPDLYAACQSAYFGGRIEMLRFGTRRGRLYHADINSAYPAAMVNLPNVSAGQWQYHATPDCTSLPTLSVVRVRWLAWPGLRWHPFPLRDEDGSIFYPRAGEGWYWLPEVRAALNGIRANTARFGAAWDWSEFSIDILGAWAFYPDDGADRPFNWIRDLYAYRQRLIQSGTGDGAQKAIKLAINSLYGKLAQHAGWRDTEQVLRNPISGKEHFIRYDRPAIPPFYNLAAAGYITSATRAQLMQAALSRPNSVLSFATDGIYSTQPLDIRRSQTKELGAWEEKIYDDCTYVGVQPGIYYLYDHAKSRWYEMSRGFPHVRELDRETAIDRRVRRIWQAWSARESSIRIEGARMVTLRAAVQSESEWTRRGCWVPIMQDEEEGRVLQIWDGSRKRRVGHLRRDSAQRLNDVRAKTPDQTLIATYPGESFELARSIGAAQAGGPFPVSAPHAGVPRRAYIEELEHLEDEISAYLEHY